MQATHGDHGAGRGSRRERRMLVAALAQPGEEGRDVLFRDRRQARLAPGSHRVQVPQQVPPVGLERVPRKATLDREVLEIAVHLSVELAGRGQPSTSSSPARPPVPSAPPVPPVPPVP